uniref:Uncharacterized protein n=1 Tax=Trichobilharzia regenti TaxID=157069 RepID=A0AA85KE67_TRIRE|nr:unnamed protein product [Trichobilharzia regenti]
MLRDVTRILGIYWPESDSTQSPEKTNVRQSIVVSPHRNQGSEISGHKSQFPRANELLNLKADEEIMKNISCTPEEASSITHLKFEENSDHDDLSECSVIQIGSGALWSCNTTQ